MSRMIMCVIGLMSSLGLSGILSSSPSPTQGKSPVTNDQVKAESDDALFSSLIDNVQPQFLCSLLLSEMRQRA